MESIKHHVTRGFWFALALLFLFETWLWDHVKEWLRAIGRELGFAHIEKWLAEFISGLSPHATLAVFAVPALAILPLKVVAVEMIAHGHWLAGIAVIFAAKTLALGVTAFLFDHCRDKLLQMPWFARFYATVLRVRAWAHALVEPVRQRLHELRQIIRERTAAIFGQGQSQFARKLAHIRALTRRGGPA